MEEMFHDLLPLYTLETAGIRSRLDLDAFNVAAKCGHTAIVKEFLNKWPEACKVCNSTNTSPLYSAAAKDHLDIDNAILDINQSYARVVCKNGKTALHNASRIGHYRIVETLVQRDP